VIFLKNRGLPVFDGAGRQVDRLSGWGVKAGIVSPHKFGSKEILTVKTLQSETSFLSVAKREKGRVSSVASRSSEGFQEKTKGAEGGSPEPFSKSFALGSITSEFLAFPSMKF